MQRYIFGTVCALPFLTLFSFVVLFAVGNVETKANGQPYFIFTVIARPPGGTTKKPRESKALKLIKDCMRSRGKYKEKLCKRICEKEKTTTPPPPPSQPQCPCKIVNGKPYCPEYNPAYSADSFEEAILNFKDTTNPDPSTAKTLKPDPKAVSKKKMSLCPNGGIRCKKCVKYLYDQFISDAKEIEDENLRNHTVDDLMSMLKDNGVSLKMKGDCQSIQVPEYVSPPKPPPGPTVCLCTPHSTGPGPLAYPTPDWQLSDKNDECLLGGSASQSGRSKGRGRRKRQSFSPDIEKVFTIKCIEKGAVDKDGLVSLCSVCWKWGILRSELSPRYINMVICETDDSKSCLKEFGKCVDHMLNYQILQKTDTNTGKMEYEAYNLNVPVACECKAIRNSAIYRFLSQRST